MIYENNGEYFKMLKPPGSYGWRGDFPVVETFALWQPVKKVLWFFWIDDGDPFWLGMYGFHKVD